MLVLLVHASTSSFHVYIYVLMFSFLTFPFVFALMWICLPCGLLMGFPDFGCIPQLCIASWIVCSQ